MSYSVRLFKLLYTPKEQLYRIKEAESFKSIWLTSIVLTVLSAIIYGWMASLGMGTNILSMDASPTAYESSKLWFVIGRVLYGLLFATVIIFVPSFIFSYITEIPYQKLIIMQQAVLLVLLFERILWIPLAVFMGLDWYASPLSFGVIMSYLTEIDLLIYFFGAISLFQLWMIWFQYRFLSTLTDINRSLLVTMVIVLAGLGWVLAATTGFADSYIISRWFG